MAHDEDDLCGFSGLSGEVDGYTALAQTGVSETVFGARMMRRGRYGDPGGPRGGGPPTPMDPGAGELPPPRRGRYGDPGGGPPPDSAEEDVKPRKVAIDGYTALAQTVIGARWSGRGTKVTRPGVVRDAVAAHKIATKPLLDAAAKLAKAGGFKKRHVPIRHTRVKGEDYVCVGAGPPLKLARPLNPKQKKLLDEYNKKAAIVKVKTAAVAKAFKKAVGSLKTNQAQVVAVAKGHLKSTDPKRKTVMRGEVMGGDDLARETVTETPEFSPSDVETMEIFGISPAEYQEIVGDLVRDTAAESPDVHAEIVGQDEPAGPDPANPGYLTDGTPDPDPVPVEDVAADVSELSQAEKDAIKRAAALSDSSSTPAPLNQAVRKVLDGIVYDGIRGWPKNHFGSFSYFTAADKGVWGYVWGWDKFPSGAFVDTTTPRWVVVFGRNNDLFGNKLNWDDLKDKPANEAEIVSTLSIEGRRSPEAGGGAGGQVVSPNGTFGPLIGKPDSDFANLRWATEDKKWFWFPTEAPEWTTVEIRNEAAIAQKKAEQLAKDAAAAQTAVDAKIKADQEAQIKAVEFQNALKEKEAEPERKRVEEEEKQKTTEEERKGREEERRGREAEADAAREAVRQEAEERKAALEAQREEAKLAAEERRAEIEAAREQAKVNAEAARAEIEAYRRAPPPAAEAPYEETPAPYEDAPAPYEEGWSGPGAGDDEGDADLLGWAPDEDPFAGVPYAIEDGRDGRSLLSRAVGRRV